MTESIAEALLVQVLQEFFDGQEKKGLHVRFVDSLNNDFNTIINDFNDYIVKKSLELNSQVNKINFHDAVKMIMEEVLAFKIQSLKMHHQMLLRSADRSKELATINKIKTH